jgi:peroxiredoxin Q/BCP
MTTESQLEGKKAPAFTLPNQEGVKVHAGDFLGQWLVLYFYPRDDTPGCTTEACEFTNLLKEFEDLNARVVGVSADSPESHTRFIRKYDLKVTLLSDADHAVMKKYGAWGMKKNYGKEYEGVIRSTVVIDPQGKVARNWPNVKAKGHAEKVKEALSELQSG